MSYRFDSAEIADLSRESARDYNTEHRATPEARTCYRCHYVPSRRGLVCVGCGATVSADEL